jgi:hypothetical protein
MIKSNILVSLVIFSTIFIQGKFTLKGVALRYFILEIYFDLIFDKKLQFSVITFSLILQLNLTYYATNVFQHILVVAHHLSGIGLKQFHALKKMIYA